MTDGYGLPELYNSQPELYFIINFIINFISFFSFFLLINCSINLVIVILVIVLYFIVTSSITPYCTSCFFFYILVFKQFFANSER